jgi:hypothetical protein
VVKAEPLDATHDRRNFDCGVEPLNRYFQQIARQHIAKGISKTSFQGTMRVSGTDGVPLGSGRSFVRGNKQHDTNTRLEIIIMKRISTLLLAGALALSFGAATGFAGDRVLKSQGRAGYHTVAVQDRDTTVALYTTEKRREADKAAQTEREPRHVIQTQGRAGYKHVIAE